MCHIGNQAFKINNIHTKDSISEQYSTVKYNTVQYVYYKNHPQWRTSQQKYLVRVLTLMPDNFNNKTGIKDKYLLSYF